MNIHPDVLAAHAQFGGDLELMQKAYEHPDLVVRLSGAEARIAELEADNARLKAEREEADHKLVDRYRDPKTGIFSFPGDVAAIVRRLDAAEALLKEAGKVLEIAEAFAKSVIKHGAKAGDENARQVSELCRRRPFPHVQDRRTQW